MRYFNPLLAFSILVLFTHCSGQSGSAAEAQKLANQISEKTTALGEAPNANLYMKAVIDGKPWTADKLIPDESKGSSYYRVNGTAGETSISFSIYLPHAKVGDVREFGEDHAADFITDDEVGFYGGRSGKFMITAMDDDGLAGKFYFTATTVRGSSKKYVVTDGIFRFPWAKGK